MSRAASKIHVEYEVLKYLMNNIDLTELEEKMLLQYEADFVSDQFQHVVSCVGQHASDYECTL